MNNSPIGYPGINGHEPSSGPVNLHHIYERLGKVIQQLDNEILLQQRVIDKQLKEIEALKEEIIKKHSVAEKATLQLQESLQHVEGNRQLINKLLSDIAHYQNDIDWYKRTYEKRSFWGVVKDKLSRK